MFAIERVTSLSLLSATIGKILVQNTASVMVNFMCQLAWDLDAQVLGQTLFQSVSGDEINHGKRRLESRSPPQGRRASSQYTEGLKRI